MKPLPSWTTRTLCISGALTLFICLTILFVPSIEIQRLASRAMAPYGLSLTSTSLNKAFPLGITAKGVTLSGQSGVLMNFDTITVKPRLLPLFAGGVIVSLKGRIGSGILEAEAEMTRKGKFGLACQKVRLEDIPFFTTVAGTQAKGELRIKGDLQGKGADSRGSLQIEARELDLRGVRISGTPLPDASYKTMQGMIRIASGSMSLESVTLQGEELYVRLSGSFPAGRAPSSTPLNLKLELMPKPEFLEKQKFIFLLLTKYLISPGHYQLPIRGTLASPLLQ